MVVQRFLEKLMRETGLLGSAFVGLWSEFAGPETEKDPNAIHYLLVHLS